jgi:hypothetical protein
MRVGGTPIYFLPGQEQELEKFSIHLPHKEREALNLLKQKRFLKDSEQEPAIRVALRSIRDFSFPFKKGEDLYWRHISVPENEIFEQKIEVKEEVKEKEEKKEIEKEVKEQKVETKPEEKKEKPRKERKPRQKKEVKEVKEQKLEIFDKPLKTEKLIEKSDFIKNIEKFLERNSIKIIREIELKKREYYAIVETENKLGVQGFLCIAKDKRNVNENDLRIGLEKAREMKSPLLFIAPGSLNKKGAAYIEEMKNLVKFISI